MFWTPTASSRSVTPLKFDHPLANNPPGHHDDELGIERSGPRRKVFPVALESAELALLHPGTAVFLDDRAGGNLRLVNIQTDYAPVNRRERCVPN